MQFTPEQLEAVKNGQSVRLNEGGTDLVVLRADVFEQLRGLLYDDSSWTDEEMDLLAAEDADVLGWEGMEPYQDEDHTATAGFTSSTNTGYSLAFLDQ